MASVIFTLQPIPTEPQTVSLQDGYPDIYIYINQSIHLLGGSMSYNYPPVIKYGHTRKLPIQFDEFPLKAFMWGDFPNHIYRGYIPTYSQFVDTFWGV